MLKQKFLSQKYEVTFTDEDYEYFNSVRDNYLSDILEKTAKLDKQLFFLSERNDFIEYKDLIYDCNRAAHSIKGTGYSYGFKFISEVSFCIEELLDFTLHNFNEKIEKLQSLFNAGITFNDLLTDVIKNYFLKNAEFNAPSEYKQKLVKFINETEKIFKSETTTKIENSGIKKNILVCGNNSFIFNNLSKLFKENKNFNFYFAPGFLEAFYELTAKKIDFIFSEFNLKEFNALSIYFTLKHTQKYADIPFYFIISDMNALLKNAEIPKNIILFKNKDLLIKIADIVK